MSTEIGTRCSVPKKISMWKWHKRVTLNDVKCLEFWDFFGAILYLYPSFFPHIHQGAGAEICKISASDTKTHQLQENGDITPIHPP